MTPTSQITTVVTGYAAIGTARGTCGAGVRQRCPEVDESGEVCPGELDVEYLILGEGYPDMLSCACSNDTTTGPGFVSVDRHGARLGDGTSPGDPNLVGCCECGRFADLDHPHTREGSTDTYVIVLGEAAPPPLPA